MSGFIINPYTFVAPLSVVDVTTFGDTAGTATHDVTLPSGCNSAHRLIMLAGATRVDWSWPAGWTEFFDYDDGADSSLAGAYRNCDGTEGATVTVTSTGTPLAAAVTFRLVGWHTDAPEASLVASGSDATPDPAELIPSWGSVNALWIAAFGASRNTARTISAYPYAGNNTYAAASGAGAQGYVGACTSITVAASQDPGAFTLSGTDAWTAATIAQRAA